jgi:hypothetical protein
VIQPREFAAVRRREDESLEGRAPAETLVREARSPVALDDPMKSSFLIVTDRGNLKAYRVEKAAGERPPRLQLVQAISLAEAHARTGDVNTDSAGRFPGTGATGDRHYNIEADRRSAKHLAEHITTVLREHNPENWSFAAPSDINQPVLDQLDAGLRKQVVENLQRDLVKLSPSDLLEHFTAIRAA